jgi:hypothetical protein
MRKLLLFFSLAIISSCGLDPSFKTTRFEKPVEILGCRLNFADNYDVNATEENGTCVFTRCLNNTQDNFNASNIDEINSYITQYNLTSSATIISNCNGRSACIHNLSKNKDPLGTKENGSCLFKACLNDNFHEYVESDALSIAEYMNIWGEEFQNVHRVESTCNQKRRYCKNAEASNYTGPTESRGDPYCIFYACTKINYQGYAKYLEFEDYLKNNPGEIIEDNSDSRCGAKLVTKEIREIDINKQALKSPVDVVFIIDDSASMGDEVTRVREGLVAIAPTLKNFNAEINVELHKVSEVNKNTKVTMLSNTTTSKIQRTEFLRPKAVDTFKIDGNTNLDALEKKIGDGLDKIMAQFGNGQERGACYIQRILEEFKSTNAKNLISILITDEDDHEKGSSKNCYQYSDRNLFLTPPNDYTHHPFTDSTGKDDLINVITEGVVNLDKEKKFGFASIHWNEKIASCPNGQGFHAESYIRLIDQLKNHKKIALEGDICQKDYEPVLENTLADTIREIIGYKYLVGSLDKNPEVTKVELIENNQNVIELGANDYTFTNDGVNLYIQINESLFDLLRKSKKIRIYVTEDQ